MSATQATENRTLNVAPGSLVRVRDADWLVTNASPTQDGLLVEVTGLSELVRDTRAAFYEHLDEILPYDPRKTKVRADDSPKYRRSRLWLESTLRKTPIPLGEGRLSVSTQMLTDALGYQRSAVQRALSNDNLRPRILLADTVGLGKTIEIGMILSELVRRGRGERILIVTPKHVLEQMQFEMWTRFALPFVRLDSVGIQRVRQKLPATRNPFSLYKRVIISMDTLKQDRYLNHLRKHQWDAVVIDESHNLTGSGTQNNTLARVLAPNTEALILASATPHNGSKESFAELVRLLEPTAVGPDGDIDRTALDRLVVRRHRHSPEVAREVGDDWVERKELQHLLVDASPEEDAVAHELADVWLYPASGASPYSGENKGLFPWTLAKAYLSSPPALVESVRNRIRTLGDELIDAQMREREALERLLTLARASADAPSAKLGELVRYLKGIGVSKTSDTRAVVFSERVPTLLWIREQLQTHLGLKPEQVAVLHGGLSDVEQQKIVESFKLSSSPIRILVTGDIASEGVNLHSQCHELIHFDIPWSLIRIEQRNGRIDRYGQRHAPQITTLLLRPSHEKFAGDVRVLTALVKRENEAHGALGDAGALMGKYSVTAEEKAVEDALVKGKSLEDVIPTPDAAATDDDPWLSFILGEADHHADTSTEVTVSERITTGLFPSDAAYLASALEEVFETPAAPQAAGGVEWREHTGYGLVEIHPTDDLRQRLSVLPQSYLAERRVVDDMKLAITPALAQASLEDARDDRSNQKGLWPEAHYLGPLHPVLDWVGDRTLARLGRDEVFVVRGDVFAPTVLVLGSLTNERGQVIATNLVAVSGMSVQPFADAAEAFDELGVTHDRSNPSPVADVDDLQKLIPTAVHAAEEHLRLTSEAAAQDVRRRVSEWSDRVQEWVDASGDLVQRAEVRERTRRVREESEVARTMLPARHLARPLLVIVPEEN
ncbi:helicase-related protein [Microbacterium enclense]|uniref:Helicase conserved C-terminal domain-containing protein n=1 Tax=Microbacterium enclense TaxID=993073 RepID=A0A1G6J488_9MICO|nr:helicase-related protein [Microbacterium enclense]KSU54741.1 helicase [Microbacterium enclense]SDC13608.1 Helicase conserved C-terminal domain-containing protein [Microbacterium enclense]